MTAPSNANTSGLAPTDALRLVPVEPTEAVLTNMAIRFDHGLGCPGYYDNPYFFEGPSHARRFEAAKTTMRQLYEEVVLSAAAPASPLPGGGWQDISTAPKDGTLIMVGAPDCGVSLVRWMLDAWIDEQGFTQGSWPTHWMPLPAAPTGEPK